MQALILAGGKGTRLRPYTANLPKPLMPIGDVPILEILVKQLESAGVTSIIMAVGYLSHMIEAYFKDGSDFGVSIKYSHEKKTTRNRWTNQFGFGLSRGQFFNT